MKTFASIPIVIAAMSLAGCETTSNSGSGSGTTMSTMSTSSTSGTATSSTTGGSSTNTSSGGSSPSSFDSAHSALSNRLPTTATVSGTASFVGQMAILAPGTAPAPGRVTNDDNTIIGDMQMTVNFDPGVTNPVTGSATNFEGTLGGNPASYSGTLTTQNHINNSNSPNNGVATSSAPGPLGTVTTTSVSATMDGTLTATSGATTFDGDVSAGFTAPVLAPAGAVNSGDASAIRGGVSVFVRPSSGGTSQSTAGTFVVERQ